MRRQRISTLGYLILFCLSSAFADAEKGDADTNADHFKNGLTHFYFDGWGGEQISVWVYIPQGIDRSSAPILMMMHGAKRGAARYLSEWDGLAEQNGFIVVAPEFDKARFPGSANYNHGNRYDKNGVMNAESQWTFSAIEPLFDQVRRQIDSAQDGYTLYGHSAGSQFAHRFMYAKPEARVKRFLLANAGWYTFPDQHKVYPLGLGGLNVSDETLKKILQTEVVVLLGDQDNDANHPSLNRDDGVAEQGPHRFARGQRYFDAAATEANRLGADFAWRLHIVEGVAHSNGGMARAAAGQVK